MQKKKLVKIFQKYCELEKIQNDITEDILSFAKKNSSESLKFLNMFLRHFWIVPDDSQKFDKYNEIRFRTITIARINHNGFCEIYVQQIEDIFKSFKTEKKGYVVLRNIS